MSKKLIFINRSAGNIQLNRMHFFKTVPYNLTWQTFLKWLFWMKLLVTYCTVEFCGKKRHHLIWYKIFSAIFIWYKGFIFTFVLSVLPSQVNSNTSSSTCPTIWALQLSLMESTSKNQSIVSIIILHLVLFNNRCRDAQIGGGGMKGNKFALDEKTLDM